MGVLLPNAVCDEELAFVERLLLYPWPQSTSSMAPSSGPHLCGWRVAQRQVLHPKDHLRQAGHPMPHRVFPVQEVFSIYVFIWPCQGLVAAHRLFDLHCSM